MWTADARPGSELMAARVTTACLQLDRTKLRVILKRKLRYRIQNAKLYILLISTRKTSQFRSSKCVLGFTSLFQLVGHIPSIPGRPSAPRTGHFLLSSGFQQGLFPVQTTHMTGSLLDGPGERTRVLGPQMSHRPSLPVLLTFQLCLPFM